MLALQQLRFLDALLVTAPDDQVSLLGIKPGYFTAAERLAIYRNNLRENFCTLLELEYPVIRQLVGADYFRQTALQYLVASPSRSGDLFHAGREFPSFLRRQFPTGEFAYLPDVAALEWAFQEGMVAADDARLFDVQGLLAVPTDRLERLRFELHPATRIVRSRFPIVQIWQAHQGDTENIGTIDLGSGGENALLARPARSTAIQAIGDGAAACLVALAEGEPLGKSVEAGLAADPGFDLQKTMPQWLQRGVLAAWSDPDF
jgi:hypothetical protein